MTHTTDTASLVARAKAISEKATPGPWHVGHIDESLDKVEIESPDGIVMASEVHRNNEAFFCQGRTLLPLLADAVQRLQVETEGRWQDMLNTQDRMVTAEERLEAATDEITRLTARLKLADDVIDEVGRCLSPWSYLSNLEMKYAAYRAHLESEKA